MTSERRIGRLDQAFESLTSSMEAKYRPWLYEDPLFIGRNRQIFMQRAQSIMYRLVTYIADHYRELERHVSHEPQVRTFLRRLQGIPLREGTFRTDFVVDEHEDLYLIEITCRYPLNGFFRSIGTDAMNKAAEYRASHGLEAKSYRRPLLEKLDRWIGDSNRVVIIQGSDSRDNESYYLPPLLQEAGIDVKVCSHEEWLQHGQDWAVEAAIMAELTFEEWLATPFALVTTMLHRPLLNDPRIVFTMHDKSFFALVNEDAITSKALTREETEFIKKAFAETYLPVQNLAAWESARENPMEWILKPRRLGRSVGIVAGALVSLDEWRAAIDHARENHDTVLQRWHLSKKVTGRIRDDVFEHYFAGTLLYWGERFFGPGINRASSYPVSNVKDNRMISNLVAESAEADDYPELPWL